MKNKLKILAVVLCGLAIPVAVCAETYTNAIPPAKLPTPPGMSDDIAARPEVQTLLAIDINLRNTEHYVMELQKEVQALKAQNEALNKKVDQLIMLVQPRTTVKQ